MTRVLVLGAGGFLGRRLVTLLAAETDITPVALLRADRGDRPAGVEVRLGDATDPAALRTALEGIDQAVNCIAGSPETMVAATRALCGQGRQVGLGRSVHLSSMAVYGEATGTVDEEHALETAAGGYAGAKVACERLVEESGLDAVTLRPGCIHGPGSPQWTGRIAAMLRAHRLGDLGESGDGVCNLSYVDDVACAVIAALAKPEAGGQAFNVSDPAPGTWNHYFMALARAIGAVPVRRIPARQLKLETKLLAPPLKIAEIVAGRLHRRSPLPEPIPPSLARLWRQDITLDPSRADRVLGFARIPPGRAIAASAAWLATPPRR